VKSVKTNWAGLAAAPFNPKRPRLEEARTVLAPWFARMRAVTDEGARDELVREAWECCASEGLISLDWLSSDRRWLRVHAEHAREQRDQTLDLTDPSSTSLIDQPHLHGRRSCSRWATGSSGARGTRTCGS